jgi:hypothetical protein
MTTSESSGLIIIRRAIESRSEFLSWIIDASVNDLGDHERGLCRRGASVCGPSQPWERCWSRQTHRVQKEVPVE